MNATVPLDLDQMDEVNLCLRRAEAVSELLTVYGAGGGRDEPDVSPTTVSVAARIIQGELDRVRFLKRRNRYPEIPVE